MLLIRIEPRINVLREKHAKPLTDQNRTVRYSGKVSSEKIIWGQTSILLSLCLLGHKFDTLRQP